MGRSTWENVVSVFQPIPESSEPIAHPIGWRGSTLRTNTGAYFRPGELNVSCGAICDVLQSPESGSMQSDGTDLGCTTLDNDIIMVIAS